MANEKLAKLEQELYKAEQQLKAAEDYEKYCCRICSNYKQERTVKVITL